MMTKNFQQALQAVKSELLSLTPRLPLPKAEVKRGFDTPYLRRRMHGRLRGYYG